MRAHARFKVCSRLLPNLVGGVSVSGVMKFSAKPIKPLLYSAVLSAAALTALAQTPDQSPLSEELTDGVTIEEPDQALEGVLDKGPDYSQLSKKQEQAARLDALFERLKNESDAEAAKLIAEEIWAIWLDSGSASVDMILLRGTAFEKRGATEKARRMYDHVTSLMPEYAEGWARSARLAMEEEDYGRALADAAQALVLEPREFYALWTMGNVFEKLGRMDEAFQAYSEAIAIYPEHPAIKARVESMRGQIDGGVL